MRKNVTRPRHTPKRGFRLAALGAIAMLGALASEPVRAQVASPSVLGMVGGGNLTPELAPAQLLPTYEALHGVGARLGRMNSYLWRDASGNPTPKTMDAAMAQARQNNVTPMVLLEYYGSDATASSPQSVGSYAQWFQTGRAVAQRFRPNGDWARAQGIRNWGVRVFSAMNEPDVEQSIPLQAYHDALAGYADGVHSVDASLKVIPGGFATCNSQWDSTLRGYGPAIGDLLNSGRLDGIDLHTYYHQHWFPIEQGRHFSAQACFDAIKSSAHVTRDIAFYATETNIAKVGWPDATMSDATAADLFLTGMWDNLGVAGNDGHHPVAQMAFPWNLGETYQDASSIYAMSLHHAPWVGDSRSLALQILIQLTGGMHVTSVNLTRGEVNLAGPTGTVLVWHDRTGWTDHPGSQVSLAVAAGIRTIEVWTAEGLAQTVTVNGATQVSVTGLSTGHTYMFLYRS